MNRPFQEGAVIPADASAPEAAWIFAQIILGKSLPRPPSARKACARHVGAHVEREQLEWLAKISPKHEQMLQNLLREEAKARADREQLEWLAQISTKHEVQLRELLAEEAALREAQSRYEQLGEDQSAQLQEWDPSKHPRRGSAPNAGWFASTGGTGGGGSEAKFHLAGQKRARKGTQPQVPQRPLFERAIDPNRISNKIASRSGTNWSGDRVLHATAFLAPKWLPFVKNHVTLNLASNGAKEPSTTVRAGETGPLLKDLTPTERKYATHTTIHFEIPSHWNDIQVVQYMMNQFADENEAFGIAHKWSAQVDPKLSGELREDRFRNGLSTIASLAEGYLSAIAGASIGGQLAVATWDIHKGENLSAALNVAFALPLGKIAKKGADLAGGIALKAGDKLVAVLPVSAIKQIEKLAPDQKALLQARLQAAKTSDDEARIVNEFLAIKFNRHHPLPKFLGGEDKQLLATIPESIHKEFHAVLRDELRAAGFPLKFGGSGAKAANWEEHFAVHQGSQGRAFDAVLKASRAMDAKYGTAITQKVWENLVGDKFFLVPLKK